MATYYPYLHNQTEVLSSTYLGDQMYLPQPSSGSSYMDHFSTEKSTSELENSINFEQNNGEQNLSAQALSLSLGTQFPTSIDVPTYEYQYVLSPHVQEYDFEAYKLKSPTPTLNICNVEYMKAAQGLLDEIVSVQKSSVMLEVDKQKKFNKFEVFGSKDMDHKTNGNSPRSCDSSSKSSSELSPMERQHLKVNLENLFSMLDEVDRRYRKYCHQMQIIESSFETMAGRGAAKSYTSLALCTISRQFRCLRDSINGQIIKVRQSLGEKDTTTPGVEGKLTRLRIVDQQIRQQAAIQQFGVMRNSWRPQRGLPGNSVSVLRAWLFEHFLHPYPKDSEKIMLSRHTGLTRGQVANWFINARVRLWKPMVEEMYKEEFGDMDINSSPDPSPRTPTTSKPWSSFKNTIEEQFKINNTITKSEVDSEPTLIPTIEPRTGTSTPVEQFLVPPMNQLKGCTARLGFQNGTHEQIEVDYKTVSPKHTKDGDFSVFKGIDTFAVAKQVSLALGLEQVKNDSLLIASSEMQFAEDYKGDYLCVDHQTSIGSMTKTF